MKITIKFTDDNFSAVSVLKEKKKKTIRFLFFALDASVQLPHTSRVNNGTS